MSSWFPAVTTFLACERTALSPEDDPASFGEDVIMLHQVHQSMPYKTRSVFLLKKKKHMDCKGEGMSLLRTPLFTSVLSFSLTIIS